MICLRNSSLMHTVKRVPFVSSWSLIQNLIKTHGQIFGIRYSAPGNRYSSRSLLLIIFLSRFLFYPSFPQFSFFPDPSSIYPRAESSHRRGECMCRWFPIRRRPRPGQSQPDSYDSWKNKSSSVAADTASFCIRQAHYGFKHQREGS